MSLSVLAGPANAGKVALLLERYLATLEQDPVLIVPYRSDVDRVERELLATCGALVGGSIGTFDDLFERVARDGGSRRPIATDAQRNLIVRGVVSGASLNGLGPSARFAGFAEALGGALRELEAGLVDPDELDGDLGRLYAAYRAELDRLGLWDRDLERRYAVDRISGELESWAGRPVFAYGFEDLTGTQWALLDALAGRADVTVSLPYEPGRAAFASLSGTMDDLGALASGRIEELAPRYGEIAPAALAHLERHLFSERPDPGPQLEGAIRFLEGAGQRGTLELVAEELLDLLRAGVPAEEIVLVCPALDRVRAPLETALGGLGVPYAFEGRIRLGQTAFGRALLSLLRFEWLGGDRNDLYAFLRSPFSGLTRAHVDYLEGRLRGRAVNERERVIEETLKLRGKRLPILDGFRDEAQPGKAVQDLATAMVRAAYGLDSPPVSDDAKLDLRAHEEVESLVAELAAWIDLGGTLTREELFGALEHATVRLGSPGEAGRVAVVDLLRARTRRVEVVFVLGLEEGRLPRRAHPSPFIDDDLRRGVDERSRRARLTRPDAVSRERYFFYAACTRPSRRLYLVREAATDEGSPRESSPFWDEARDLFDVDDVARWTKRRPLAALTWQVDRAPSERERLRALSALAAISASEASALAEANGWERRLERARGAFERPTVITDPAVLAELPGPHDVRGDRARILRHVLVDLVPRARDQPAHDRCGGRCADARLGRAPGPLQVLLRAPQAARHRPARPGAHRRVPDVPRRVPRGGHRRWSVDRADRPPAPGAPRDALARPRAISCAPKRSPISSSSRRSSRCRSARSARPQSCSVACRSATSASPGRSTASTSRR